MRKTHNVKSTPMFTRAQVEIELGLPVTVPRAYVGSRYSGGITLPKVHTVPVWARGTVLVSKEATADLIDCVKQELGDVVPVFRRFARAVA